MGVCNRREHFLTGVGKLASQITNRTWAAEEAKQERTSSLSVFDENLPRYCSLPWHFAHTWRAVSIVFLCRLYCLPHLRGGKDEMSGRG